MYPVRVAGYSHQTFWWDIAAGRPVDDTESFDFIYSFNTGDEVEYKGDSEGHLVKAAPMDRNRIADDIQKQLDAQQIPGVTVKPTDQGVTITLDNVNFPPNSDTLLPAEQEKLRRIAEILLEISRTGHRRLGLHGQGARLHGGGLPDPLRKEGAGSGELPPFDRRAARRTDDGAR